MDERKTGAAGAKATNAKARARRVDQQIECPRCRCYVVPTTCTRGYPAGRKRYRACHDCRWVFTTWQPRGGEERVSG